MVNSDLSPDIRLQHWRIRLQYFPPIAFLGVLVSVISRFTSFPSYQVALAETIMQSIGMTAVYFFWVYVAKTLLYFDREKLTRLQIMAIGASGGLLMAGSQSFLSWVFQVPLQTNFIMRAIGNVVVAAFWLPLQSVVVGNFRRYARLKRDIRDEFLRQESVQLARRRALEEYRRKIEENIQDELKVTTAEAHKLFSSLNTKSAVRLPEYLRVISDEYFRLTAHKLDSKIKAREVRFINFKGNFLEFKAAVLQSVVTRPLNPTWFSIVVVVTIAVPLTAKAEYVLIPTLALFTGMSTYFVQNILLRSFQKIENRQILATVAATIGNIALPIVIAHLIPDNDPKLGNHIAYVVVVITVTCLGHIAQAGILKEEELRTSSTKELLDLKSSEREQNAEFSKITRDWAKYIHGNYTTKLESAALAIEAAITIDDAEATEHAISEVEKTLKLDSTRSISTPLILIEEVQDRCANWQGLIDISIDNQIPGDLAIAASVKDVGDCVEEAVLNAVRHGDCSVIKIDISDHANSISIQIQDNGRGFSGAPRGFGSSIYEESTKGDWKLWRDEKNKATILELIFAKS